MVSRFEHLPNELIFLIFSKISWSDILICFWSLNKRLNLLICSFLSRIDNKENSGLVFIEPDLSFKRCQTILFPLISQSSLLSSSIRRIHFDGTNSNSFVSMNEWLFDNERKSSRFSNLKSLILTRCLLIKSLIDTLPFLIKYQLDELTLIFDKTKIGYHYCSRYITNIQLERESSIKIFEELIEIIFSNECQLTSLKLDFIFDDYSLKLHQCLKLRNNISLNLISIQNQILCPKLRYLHLHIQYTFFLENLINYVPFLERLVVIFHQSLDIRPRSSSDIQILIKTNGNWFNKVSKLKYFSLKSCIKDNLQFSYFKWLLNNLNHIEKLRIHIQSPDDYIKKDEIIWNSILDASFVYKYCLPDEIINLKEFDFDIIRQYESTKKTIDEIIHSFQIHPCFLNNKWTNINCLFDPFLSYQHLSSCSIYKRKSIHNFIHVPKLYSQSNIRYVWIDINSIRYLSLEQFNQLFPNVFCIKVNMNHNLYPRGFSELSHLEFFVYYDIKSLCSLIKYTEIETYKLNNNQLCNVTRLDLNPHFNRIIGDSHKSTDGDSIYTKLLARLISMPVQLKSLRIQHFEWLLHIIQYASDELKQNALSTVEYVEFYLPSCHIGSNENIQIGRKLVPFLSIYMPHLRTLRLWRPDDFPWTSIRPLYAAKPVCYLQTMMLRWYQSLQKSDAINRHVFVFKQDLDELIEKLNDFVFLEILGEIHEEKIEPYRSMVQKHFPNSQCHVERSRFRLWV